MSEGTLRHTFFRGLKMFPNHLILKHYPIRTAEQGYTKINHDRQIHEGAGDHYKNSGLGKLIGCFNRVDFLNAPSSIFLRSLLTCLLLMIIFVP